LYETVRRLARSHEVAVYALSTAEHDFCDLRPHVTLHSVVHFEPLSFYRSPLGRLNQLQRWRDLYRLQLVERQIAREIDRQHYDVVYVQPSQWTQAPLILQYLRTPTVYYVQETLRDIYEPPLRRPHVRQRRMAWLDRLDPLIPLYRRTIARLDRGATRRATIRLANSRYTADNIWRTYGCHAEVSYLGVDADAFQQRPGIPKTTAMLSVGALRPNKGFDFLLQALSRLSQSAAPTLRIVANADDPAERAYLNEMARDGKVNLNIEIMVDHDRLVQRYCEAAVFVYAPVREPFGLAALEAMACGTPVVAVAEGGVSESVTDRETGRLVPRDVARFAEVLEDLLGDTRLREQYGCQARTCVVDRWTWERAVERLAHHLGRAAGGAHVEVVPR
jgi:glycosyltransferase involved in cell wall biosynthesis